MEHLHLIDLVLFASFFLIGTAVLQLINYKTSFPYTVALLIAGLISQLVVRAFHLPAEFTLSPELIFYILLPMLLFEAAMHINIHQFKIQFKTISFFATFGLLVSVFVVAFGLSWLIGLPFEIALLFGAIISATDPIAVLALFKSLGAPKRLALVADGESMFNDATGVIVFRVVSSFVVAGTAFKPERLFDSAWDFTYIFIGSILLGAFLGYIFGKIFEKIRGQRLVITTLTTALGIGSFVGAEHFFHLSGVITTVMAGVVLGNVALGKMDRSVNHFLEEYWEYLGFISLSLVFFFAAYNLNLELFTREIGTLFIVIAVVLVARSVSVYVTALLTNTLPLFKDEPNIPLSWQHILNWGGLRGVIPLVLVYSLPDDFMYKQQMLQFTLATLLFTLFVNGLTIKSLLLKLKLHLPRKEEEIIRDEMSIFALSKARTRLKNLDKREFSQEIINKYEKELVADEQKLQKHLQSITTPEEFLNSLKLQSIQIERERLHDLYDEGRVSENVMYEFESELDLQQDALEYPEVYKSRATEDGGFMIQRTTFRQRLIRLRRRLKDYPVLKNMFGMSEDEFINERYSKLRARVFTSYAVLDYLTQVKELFKKSTQVDAIAEVKSMQVGFIEKNKKEIKELERQFPKLITLYQNRVLKHLLS
jgi:CPA1 family monovalent cation:H+ antiporter